MVRSFLIARPYISAGITSATPKHLSVNKNYDIIIAGSGMYGTVLGSILAKNGRSVLIIEKGQHPRFAIGEALLPQSAIWPFMIGEYFDMPEIAHLSHADRILDHITPHCGIKHSIGFAWHRKDDTHQPDHTHQLIPPHLPFYSESHLMRQDVDQYLLEVAKNYGCDYLDNTTITDVNIFDDRVAVSTHASEFRCEYYVDASGVHSILAQKMGYRNDGDDLQTHSRSIFTHVAGLPPFDQLIAESPGQSKRLHDGTLHHVFPGGWLWVIPFDNYHRSDSKLASVGLQLDPRFFPENSDITAEEEFFSIIGEYPSIFAHLKYAEAVRPWIRTGRLQYAATESVGHRHFISNNTYGFIDPLYSNGLINTFESVFYAANLLLEAFASTDSARFDADRFKQLNDLHREQLKLADFMVANAYKAMHSFGTWNAWTQMWLGQVLFNDLWLQRACFQYFSTGNKARFQSFMNEMKPGMLAPFNAAKNDMFQAVANALHLYRWGEMDEGQTEQTMLEALKCQEWLPKHVYDWGNKNSRHVDFSKMELVGSLLQWGMADSPIHIREGLFDFELPPA